MNAGGESALLILDACVLIDFYESDLTVIGAVSRVFGQVHVASPVLAEVEALDESAAASAGLTVIEPTLAMFATAAQKRGRLSANDHLCLLLAKSENWTCVSNDKALRKACAEEGVSVMWGLAARTRCSDSARTGAGGSGKLNGARAATASLLSFRPTPDALRNDASSASSRRPPLLHHGQTTDRTSIDSCLPSAERTSVRAEHKAQPAVARANSRLHARTRSARQTPQK